MTALHITNGDVAANIIKQSVVSGDVLPWRDPMHHGPFPADIALEKLSRIRAQYLSAPGVDIAEAERDFRLRDEHLRAASQYENIILWFEHDLLDQLQILQILDWFGDTDFGDATLEIICIGSFPGIEQFRGIGELDGAQMASLFDKRLTVSAAATLLAKSGWAAFRSEDPRKLFRFMQGELGSLPFLRSALLRHFEEYPSTRNGLSRTENQLLSLVSNGVDGPVEMFTQNMDFESALYIGDWSTFSTISVLCEASLLTCQSGPFLYPPGSMKDRQAFQAQRFSLTEVGTSVLNGERHAADLINRDLWLGGIHLRSDRPMWTWDATKAGLVLRQP